MTASLLPAGTKAPDGSTLSDPITDWEQISGQCTPASGTIQVSVPDCAPGCNPNHRQIVEWWAHAPDPPGCGVSTVANPNDRLDCPIKADGRICIYIKKSPGPTAATAITSEPVHVIFTDLSTFDASPTLGSATAGCGPADHPVNTSPPTIGGSPYAGQTLTCNVGTWSGTPPLTPTYQWKKNGVPIPGATGSTYTPTQDDVGSTIDCEVTMTNAEGDTGTASSAQEPIVKPPASQQEAFSNWYYRQQYGKDPPKPGKGSVEIKPGPAPGSDVDLTQLVLRYAVHLGTKKSSLMLSGSGPFGTAAKVQQVGTLGDAHFSAGQATALVPLHLTSLGRRALVQKGKITVSVTGTATGVSGPLPAPDGTLKLVAPRPKK